MSNTITEHLSTLSNREFRALNEAVTVIYFNDSSDYINGLWGVVETLLGKSIDEDFSINELRKLIDELL